VTLLLSASLALAGTVRHALVVGANDGGGVLPPLKYAETDAERMASLLTELGEFDEELVTVLYQPTEAELRAALAHHAAVAEEWDDDLFTFYYSGHADAVGLRLGDERYHFEALKHDLRAIPSTVRLGVLDACRSGTITRLKGAQVAESILGADDAVAEGEAWLTASADDELAQESESLRGGFYTHYLMSGMRGAADLSGDGVVELYELHQYTYDRVVESTGRTGAGSQHPRLTSQLTTGTGVALTDVRRASAQLVLSTGDAGLVAVFRMPDRAELAEFTKTADREMVLAVPPGSYLVRRRFQESTYEARFGLADGGRFRVEEWGRPLLEASTVRGVGDPRVAELITESEEYQDRMNLAQSPVMAGGGVAGRAGGGPVVQRRGLEGPRVLRGRGDAGGGRGVPARRARGAAPERGRLVVAGAGGGAVGRLGGGRGVPGAPPRAAPAAARGAAGVRAPGRLRQAPVAAARGGVGGPVAPAQPGDRPRSRGLHLGRGGLGRVRGLPRDVDLGGAVPAVRVGRDRAAAWHLAGGRPAVHAHPDDVRRGRGVPLVRRPPLLHRGRRALGGPGHVVGRGGGHGLRDPPGPVGERGRVGGYGLPMTRVLEELRFAPVVVAGVGALAAPAAAEWWPAVTWDLVASGVTAGLLAAVPFALLHLRLARWPQDRWPLFRLTLVFGALFLPPATTALLYAVNGLGTGEPVTTHHVEVVDAWRTSGWWWGGRVVVVLPEAPTGTALRASAGLATGLAAGDGVVVTTAVGRLGAPWVVKVERR
jgi:hypothetical protein